MKLNIKKFNRGQRIISVELRFFEDNEVKQDKFIFYYNQLSSRRSRELDSMFRDDITEDELKKLPEDERLRYERALPMALASFDLSSPDIVGDNGEIILLTVEELDEWELRNLIAIRNAISEDTNPNPTK